ncbi:hypothetical protein LCGC14_0362240 [marine sediment metagenome]|uniref:Uncharacterized protein n=1 Tax=marine sediment metagenome TaxID=412755 RepID=A0A0F9VUU3_9ZZZZ
MSKEKNLVQGNIAADLKSQLDNKLSDLGFTVAKTVETLVEFWLELPVDMQIQLYTHKARGEKLEAIITRIVDERLIFFVAKAEPDSTEKKQKPGQHPLESA